MTTPSDVAPAQTGTNRMASWLRYQMPYAAFAYAYFPITLTKRVLLRPHQAGQDLMVRRFWDRWGWLPATLPQGANGARPLWVHMNSGGEVVMAQSLLRQLQQRGHQCCFSSDSYDAQGLLRQWYGDERVFFPPWDTGVPVGRVVRRVQPKALVFVANAYFPSLLARAKRQGIRTLLINGVLSRNVDVGNKGLRRALALQVHRSLDAVAAQSEADAEAFLALGLPRDRVTVTGKLEGDLAALRLSPEARRALRLSLGLPDDAPVFMVGSLHPGEEPTVLEAFRRMRAALPQVRLVVAPRWLHDAPVMAERLQAQGYRVERRTALQQRPPTGPLAYDALLIDTFGELRTLYGAADAAFIGSSLVPINIRKGGHNILEPLAHDVPPLFGPHMNLWQDATIQLLAAWPGLAVDGPAALADRAVEVLTQRAPLDAVRRTGRSIIEQDSGALNRTLQFLDRWMETA